MDALLNAQVGLAFGLIVVLLVVYLLIMGWTRRVGDPPGQAAKKGPAGSGPQSPAVSEVQAEIRKTAPPEGPRKRKQFQIQGKDAEIAASVLRRMLSDHDKS
jgi:hypothetical protein